MEGVLVGSSGNSLISLGYQLDKLLNKYPHIS